MPLYYKKFITRQDLKDNPNWLFVFGDNIVGQGYGGQARQMRGEQNAVGIPTKYNPNMHPHSFFDNTHDDLEYWWKKSKPITEKLKDHHDRGGIIIWPLDGIGTGLAKLDKCAPLILEAINQLEERLT